MALSQNGYTAMKGYSRVLGEALAEKDAVTRRHCERVIDLAAAFGRHCRLDTDQLRLLRMAAALHDIGKIGIRDAVLLKPGKFDDGEWREMRTHAERGERIVRSIAVDGAGEIACAVRHHHEDFDGGGYPDGLRGEDIPYVARMVAIVDSYDAIGEPRPYQGRHHHEEVMAKLGAESGRRFDPYLLARFREMMAAA